MKPKNFDRDSARCRSFHCFPHLLSFIDVWHLSDFLEFLSVSLYETIQQANSGKDNNTNSGNNNSNNSDFSKKEEFRRYLEKAGVLDALTKVLVGLYEEPERPENAIEYIKRYIGAPPNVDVEGLKRENNQLRAELEKLKRK